MKKRIGTALALLLSLPALADDHAVTMWQLNGERNTIYLLGSIHLLRESDYPLPAEIDTAYADADTLYMEVDVDDLDEMDTVVAMREYGVTAGKTLADMMGQERFSEVEMLAAELGIPMFMIANLEPWAAALMAEVAMLMQMGFDPQFGVETHLQARAEVDGKEILGFEEAREQLAMLDSLSMPMQREMLLQLLRDGSEYRSIIDDMISAWRSGDTDYMQKNLLDDMREYRELYDVLVKNRNADWVEQIEDLTDDADNYLIVVGALHLVGKDGVPEMLRANGYEVTQIESSAP